VLQIPAATVTDDLGYERSRGLGFLEHMELIVALEQSFELEFSF